MFILSFDCDTKKDIEVVTDVHKKLLNKKITQFMPCPANYFEKGKKFIKKFLIQDQISKPWV